MDIDGPVLRELKKLQKERGEPLGKLISELLARSLARERRGEAEPAPFEWKARPMGKPRVSLRDKDALWAILDGDEAGADRP